MNKSISQNINSHATAVIRLNSYLHMVNLTAFNLRNSWEGGKFLLYHHC